MLTFKATQRLCIAGLLLMVQAFTYAQTPPDGPLISTSINGLETIDNGQIRVGVDSRYGGAITWLSAAGRGNMVNNYDRGRQIQIALYGLPEDYSRNGSPAWAGLGWNPIQAGDTYNNPSQVIAFEKHTNLLYVKTIPKQFALNNQPGEATIEHWVRLVGNVVKVHARVVMNRSDHTPYMARAQEWPCAYLNATYRHVWTYRGDNPYTYGPMSEMIPPMQQENLRPVTEPWMAATDDSGFGMAIFVPKNYQWTKAYFGSDYYDTSEFSATSSYIAATQFEQLDYNLVHEWDYEFVVGNLYTIRSYIYSQPRLAPTINYRFDTSRQGWYYFEAHDSGWPIQGQLNVTLTNRDRDQIKSPVGFWRGNDNKKMYLRAAFRTQHNFFRLSWRQLPDHEFYTLSDRFLDFPIQNDGQMRTYEIDLSQKAGWLNTTITQLNLRPSLDGPAVNGSVRIEWLSTSPDGSSAPSSTTVITPPVTTTTTPVATALQLVAPVYDCTTGAITFKTTGGDGTLIEYAGLGISDWSTSPNQQVEAYIRQNPRPISLLARQSNQLVVYVFDLGAACSGVPVVTPPPATTTVTPPVSTPLQLVAPAYDCATGAITFKTTGGDGTLIEYAGLGISNWSASPYQQVDASIRQNPRSISLLARQNGVAVIYVFDLVAACSGAPVVTPPPVTTTVTPPTPFQIVAPVYDCATGAITFKTTGGDGTLIEYAGLGITNWSASPYQQVDASIRQNPRPISLLARQNGVAVIYVFDLAAACSGAPVVTPPPVTTTVTPPTPLQMVAPVYNCATGAITFKTTGGDGTLIEYAGLGISNWSASPYQQVDASLRQNPRPISLLARQSGIAVIYVFDLAAACLATPAETVPPPTKATQPASPTSTVFQLVAPVYDCTTGAITFKTTGGDGTTVEFLAIGITAWTSNPNQRVEMELRQDPKPITLFARQNGQVVFFVFDLSTACGGRGRAAVGNTGIDAKWQMRVLGNPVSEVLTVEVNGIGNQPLTIDLLTTTGQLIERRFIQQPKSNDQYQFEVGREAPGLLLLRASSATQQHVVKVLKH